MVGGALPSIPLNLSFPSLLSPEIGTSGVLLVGVVLVRYPSMFQYEITLIMFILDEHTDCLSWSLFLKYHRETLIMFVLSEHTDCLS